MEHEKQLNLEKRIVITGGGSGGHISPAEAIVEEIFTKYSNAKEQVLYIGGKLGMEGEKVSLEQKRFENSRVNFVAIRAGKLQRYFSFKSITLLFGVIGGFIDATKVLKKFKPDIVISTGGYVTLPVVIAAKLKGAKVYIHEQTAVIGLTNKIASKFADKVFISFKETSDYLPKGKAVLTGNPVRKAIFNTSGNTTLTQKLDLMKGIREKEGKPILMIFGGGQGSHLINITLRDVLKQAVQDFQIVLQTGDNSQFKDYEVLQREVSKLSPSQQDSIFITQFVTSEEIGRLFKDADIYIGRAGANFVYEMGVIGKPSIFIPIPWVTHNEQYRNAEIIKKLGFGEIIPEGELTPEKFLRTVKEFYKKIIDQQIEIPSRDQFPTNAAEQILSIALA